MKTKIKLRRLNHTCRRVTLTLEYQQDIGTLTAQSKHVMAKSLARDWGDLNHSSTVFNRDGMLLKNYSCSGHGGYVLISDKKLDIKDFSASLASDNFYGVGSLKFFAYVFEEDCNWALLYTFLSSELWEEVSTDWNGKRSQPQEPPPKTLTEYAKESLSRWNPQYLTA